MSDGPFYVAGELGRLLLHLRIVSLGRTGTPQHDSNHVSSLAQSLVNLPPVRLLSGRSDRTGIWPWRIASAPCCWGPDGTIGCDANGLWEPDEFVKALRSDLSERFLGWQFFLDRQRSFSPSPSSFTLDCRRSWALDQPPSLVEACRESTLLGLPENPCPEKPQKLNPGPI